MISREGAGGLSLQQRGSTPAAKCEVEMDMAYPILENWLNLTDDFNAISIFLFKDIGFEESMKFLHVYFHLFWCSKRESCIVAIHWVPFLWHNQSLLKTQDSNLTWRHYWHSFQSRNPHCSCLAHDSSEQKLDRESRVLILSFQIKCGKFTSTSVV